MPNNVDSKKQGGHLLLGRNAPGSDGPRAQEDNQLF